MTSSIFFLFIERNLPQVLVGVNVRPFLVDYLTYVDQLYGGMTNSPLHPSQKYWLSGFPMAAPG